jgi:hypothetical protein
VPPTREASLDSPPSTPPALEPACTPCVYSASEPSPLLSALLYPSAQEYLKLDYQDGPTPSHYFNLRGSPRHPAEAGHPSVPEQLQLQLLAPPPCPSTVMGGLRHDSCDNASGSEHGPYSPPNHIYVPPSGGLLMARSHSINSMSNPAPYTIYSAYVLLAHPPPNPVPPMLSSDISMHTNVSPVEPQPHSDLRGIQEQPLRTIVTTNQPHLSPIPSSDSPSPVSSLLLSSPSSEHSPLLYQKPNFTIPPVNGVTYTLLGLHYTTNKATDHSCPVMCATVAGRKVCHLLVSCNCQRGSV